ncbi:MAG: competence/damage-inducible protein A [Chloroflexi bacterium]|nr:competence/damage-inducible protein A [Chloroflexota bacterium]
MTDAAPDRIVGAALLSIGTELTVGETRDTNAGELARDLTTEGVRVIRITALPDELSAVTEAFADGLVRADLVVSTGGLGPTPDDLTRESIAAVFAERPALDPSLERWLRNLWERRSLPFAEINLKQAWLIPSATPIPNDNGTAPGWWVERPDGRIVVALPGPPREMRPMWRDWVLPRLRDRGLGLDTARLTYRLTGIGESAAADLLGEDLLRSPNPIVATYARADAVDVRISATAELDRSAADLVGSAAERVRAAIGPYIWATGSDTWGEAVGEALTARGWTLAMWECGTGGSLVGLLGDLPGLVTATVVGPGSADASQDPRIAAERLRAECGATVVLAVRAAERRADTVVSVALATARGIHHERRVAFLGGPLGRSRAALTAVAILHERLREVSGGPSGRARRGRG